MAQLTIPQIIEIAKVSQYLYDDAASKGTMYGSVVDPMRGIVLYVIRKDIEYIYAGNPNYAGLIPASLYLLGLCDTRAQAFIVGGGSSVVPGQVTFIKSPIEIFGNMFGSALGWDGVNNDGLTILPTYTLQVFYNSLNKFLTVDVDWTRTADGFDLIPNGVNVPSDFDALGANSGDIFFIFISV